MQPAIEINFTGIAAAVIASFLFGWLWFGPLFGRTWARLMGMRMDAKPGPGVMVRGMLLAVVGAFLTAYVLFFSTNVWRESVWGVGTDAPAYVYGFFSGFFTWLGFYVPMLLSAVAWEGRSWKLFALNATYHFLNLQLIAMLVAYWH
jgi:hypothetical protein